MNIPDIGGILMIEIPATGLRQDIHCRNLSDAYAKMQQFKTTEPAAIAGHRIVAVYAPFPFQINN